MPSRQDDQCKTDIRKTALPDRMVWGTGRVLGLAFGRAVLLGSLPELLPRLLVSVHPGWLWRRVHDVKINNEQTTRLYRMCPIIQFFGTNKRLIRLNSKGVRVKKILIGIALWSLIVTACSPEEQATEGPSSIDEGPTPTHIPVDLTPAQRAAITALSDNLGLPADEIKLVSTEAVEWPDGCLGCPRGRTCLHAGHYTRFSCNSGSEWQTGGISNE